MRVLKLGFVGEDVSSWQRFIRGYFKDSLVEVDGKFGPMTEADTKRFQTKVKLVADGQVGLNTFAKAMSLGFAADLDDDDEEKSGPNWPKKPEGFVSLDYQSRLKVFGQFSYIPAPSKFNPEGIKITDNWQKDNIVLVKVPQLVGVSGAPADGSVSIHKKCAKQLLSVFQAWEDAGLKNRVLSWAGAWAPRYIRGSRTTLSNHAWASAFDINAPWNGLGTVPALVGQKGSVRELVMIAYENGWDWGGWFGNGRQDGMHFQAYKIID